MLRALAERGARRRAASGARRPAAWALRVGSSSTKMAASKPSEGVGGGEDALQLGHEHADEGVQVAAPLLLVVPAELAAEHLRRHLEQLAAAAQRSR